MRTCIEPGCPQLIEKGQRCPAHKRSDTRRRRRQGLTGKRGSTPKWRALRERVMRRDGNACIRCGRRDYLAVDHIDGDPTNDSLDNLQTLCNPPPEIGPSCHVEKGREDAR